MRTILMFSIMKSTIGSKYRIFLVDGWSSNSGTDFYCTSILSKTFHPIFSATPHSIPPSFSIHEDEILHKSGGGDNLMVTSGYECEHYVMSSPHHIDWRYLNDLYWLLSTGFTCVCKYQMRIDWIDATSHTQQTSPKLHCGKLGGVKWTLHYFAEKY